MKWWKVGQSRAFSLTQPHQGPSLQPGRGTDRPLQTGRGQGRKGGRGAVIGQYQHNIDAKGRLFIPAKYREELGEAFYVTIGLDGCLSVYSDAKWADLTAKFDALPIAKARSMRALFANAAKCEPDAQGRILIPAKLRRYAALEKEVVINGASKCVELWNPERWAPIEEAGLTPENLAAVMEELDF